MRMSFTRLGLSITLALQMAGCGPGFDPVSEIQSLRVLGVKKDNPYPQPGETVNLSVLWHDGLVDGTDPEARREVQLLWLPPCFNPPADQYTACFLQFFQRFVEDPNVLGELSEGDTASLTIPLDIVPSAPTPGVPRYGLTYVSFALCAGTVSFEEPEQEGALPIGCRDAEGNRLGPESFVLAYAGLFTFAETRDDGEPFQNRNPLVAGFSVEGATVPSCVDDDCLTTELETDIDCDASPARCFPACKADGDPECPEIDIRPLVDETSAEDDDVSRDFYSRNVQEQMWINYYADRGRVRGDGVRLLNDASKGWNEDYGTEFYAPREPGLVTLWAVAHDNRGGMSWARTRIKIQ